MFAGIAGVPVALAAVGIIAWYLFNPITLVSYKREIFQARADSDNILLSLAGQIQVILLNLAEFLFKFMIVAIAAFILCAFLKK